MELRGKTALVTGAAKRIGRAIALALAQEGVNLVLHYHRSFREVQETQRSAERLGATTYLARANLSRFSEVQRLIRVVNQKVRKVDILINNASVFYKTPLGRVREAVWRECIDVNLKAPFFLSQAFGIRMARSGAGKIIHLIDWTAFRPHPHYLPYAASKAGLVALTQGLARALAPHVQVNAIAPGPILPARGFSHESNRKTIRRTPLQRWGDPCDIAETVLFLVRSTDFVTGAVIPVDGGNLVV